MCGFFGAIVKHPAMLDPHKCLSATHSLSARGPDGFGVASGSWNELTFQLNPGAVPLGDDARIFLGHRRLSILDLSEVAFQPLSNERQDVWVVFNGEIYNYIELRKELLAAGHVFRTRNSDTEVLVHGYEEWGEDVVLRLEGMFAFALLDLKSRRLILARDRFGEKPLCVWSSADAVAFASDHRALLESGFCSGDVNRQAVAHYLLMGYVPAPSSIFRDVRKIQAGECLRADVDSFGAMCSRRYWSLGHRLPEAPSASEWLSTLDDLLLSSVDRRLRSDVEVGAFLSGGLDSSTVVRAARKRIPAHRLQTFGAGFPGTSVDETPFASQVAAAYGTCHSTVSLTESDLIDLLPQTAAAFDEPFADSSAIPTLAICKVARQRVKVVLSGDGGDELFGGYTRYRAHLQIARLFAPLSGWFMWSIAAILQSTWPEWVRGRGIANLLYSNPVHRYAQFHVDGWLVGQAQMSSLCPALPSWDTNNRFSTLHDLCRADVEVYLPEDLMVKVDRTSMSLGLEVRAPLLDTTLFEHLRAAPAVFMDRLAEPKAALRRLLETDTAAQLWNRPKQGFEVPLGRWFRGPLRSWVSDTLGSSTGIVASTIPRRTAEKLLSWHHTGSRDQSARLWKLLMLDQWEQGCRRTSLLAGR
jgi:asparagine synthase (glutamine-hydrolysing)